MFLSFWGTASVHRKDIESIHMDWVAWWGECLQKGQVHWLHVGSIDCWQYLVFKGGSQSPELPQRDGQLSPIAGYSQRTFRWHCEAFHWTSSQRDSEMPRDCSDRNSISLSLDTRPSSSFANCTDPRVRPVSARNLLKSSSFSLPQTHEERPGFFLFPVGRVVGPGRTPDTETLCSQLLHLHFCVPRLFQNELLWG